jgi:lysozyme family protein
MIYNYDSALEFTLKEEGGYVNNPNDSGGATNFGVIQSTYDRFRYNKGLASQSVKHITFDEVKQIYLNFWRSAACDKLFALGYGKTAAVLLDCSINHGPSQAIMFLQRALGFIGPANVDGVFGPKTQTACLAHSDLKIADRILIERSWFFVRLVNRRRKDAEFLLGWMLRIKRLRKFIGDERYLG